MKKFNGVKTEKIVTFGGSYGYKKETIKREWALNLDVIQFEELMLPCPKNYKDYLSYFYGDYMTPPEKIENKHGIIKIKL